MSYPNCDRLVEVEVQRQAINEFLDWLARKDFEIAEWDDQFHYLHAISSTSIESLVYQFFGIDEEQLRAERKELVEKLQKTTPSLFHVVNTTQEDK